MKKQKEKKLLEKKEMENGTLNETERKQNEWRNIKLSFTRLNLDWPKVSSRGHSVDSNSQRFANVAWKPYQWLIIAYIRENNVWDI